MDINIYGGNNLIAPFVATIKLHFHFKIILVFQDCTLAKKKEKNLVDWNIMSNFAANYMKV